jgi:hypothetical protein
VGLRGCYGPWPWARANRAVCNLTAICHFPKKSSGGRGGRGGGSWSWQGAGRQGPGSALLCTLHFIESDFICSLTLNPVCVCAARPFVAVCGLGLGLPESPMASGKYAKALPLAACCRCSALRCALWAGCSLQAGWRARYKAPRPEVLVSVYLHCSSQAFFCQLTTRRSHQSPASLSRFT